MNAPKAKTGTGSIHSSRLPGLCREAGVADVQSQETIAETLTIICSTLSFAATDGETEAGREVGQ